MTTKRHSSQRCANLLALAVIILVSYSPTAVAQQWNTNGNDISNANTGNVGIGTTSPATKLEISSASPLLQMSDTSPTGVKITLGTAGSWFGLSANRNLATASRYDVGKTTAGYFMFVTNSNSFHWWGTTPTNNTDPIERMRLDKDGNLGIGTSTPGSKLHVTGGANQWVIFERSGKQLFLNANSADGNVYAQVAPRASDNMGLSLSSRDINPEYLFVTTLGNVGIGTTTPANKLHVAGSITVDGNINAKYQDVAEWVPSSAQLPAGTVVILDPTKSNQVVASIKSYDTSVAGVISAQPGITLGERSDNKVLVATTGRIRVKVDATNGPIQIGDLLVTSDREGFAMKSMPVEISSLRIHRPGTLIGKALEPLAYGTGEILVLLSLQ